MTCQQIEIAETLFRNTQGISFGSVSVEIKIHAGKCVGVIYTTSKNTRQRDEIVTNKN